MNNSGYTYNYCNLIDGFKLGEIYSHERKIFLCSENPIHFSQNIQANFKLFKIQNLGETDNSFLSENCFYTNSLKVEAVINSIEELELHLKCKIQIKDNKCLVHYLNGYWFYNEIDSHNKVVKYQNISGHYYDKSISDKVKFNKALEKPVV